MLLKSVLVFGLLAGSVDLQLAKVGEIVDTGFISPARIVSQLRALGFPVQEIKFVDDRYVIQVVASGRRVTFYVNLMTGQAVSAGDDEE